MRSATKIALACGVALAATVALAQQTPESILPPGFGSPAPSPAAAPPPDAPRPAANPGDVPPLALTPPDASLEGGDVVESGNALSNTLAVAPAVDLPPEARRSTERVGLLTTEDGGVEPGAFGNAGGRFLTTLMERMNAPLASRWASILLRRVLLSQTDTPAGVAPADWIAERAWLLVRMGAADDARALVARVDAENFSPRLYDVALQAALASADPASLCGVADAAAAQSTARSWPLVQAMCAGLSGESGNATALIDAARQDGTARGVDLRLAEKVTAAGTNARRATTIVWDDVPNLTAWRYGLAAATGVAIPIQLFGTVGPQVQAWAARAPLYPATARVRFADRAATLGMFSSAALVDFYGALWDDADPSDRGGTTADNLRTAYVGGDESKRVEAMRGLWGEAGGPYTRYARYILTARAAGMVAPFSDAAAGDVEGLVAAMMAAGLDIQAERWSRSAESGSAAWALLATGAPRPSFAIDRGGVQAFAKTAGGEDTPRARLLFAALAGLGRLSPGDVDALASDFGVAVGRRTSWTDALDRAAAANQPATVALIAAAGMQTLGWDDVPPEALYHIVAALHRSGLDPEARMIAAEAVTRA